MPEYFERILDDFVFLCFLSGNDFLPHLPSMKINDQAILRIIDVYKRIYLNNQTRGVTFITDSGQVNLNAFLPFLNYFAQFENSILLSMEEKEKRMAIYKSQTYQARLQQRLLDGNLTTEQKVALQKEQLEAQSLSEIQIQAKKRNEYYDKVQIDPQDTKTLAVKYVTTPGFSYKNSNWRRLFYKNQPADKINDMCYQYLRGMCWVCTYYCNELADWSYFYPYHGAPLIQDLARYIENNQPKVQPAEMNKTFSKTAAFTPFEQLLAVLPPYSCQALPECLQQLMTDPNSPLRSFYPNRYEVDITEVSQMYQGEVLLPFIDEKLLKE